MLICLNYKILKSFIHSAGEYFGIYRKQFIGANVNVYNFQLCSLNISDPPYVRFLFVKWFVSIPGSRPSVTVRQDSSVCDFRSIREKFYSLFKYGSLFQVCANNSTAKGFLNVRVEFTFISKLSLYVLFFPLVRNVALFLWLFSYDEEACKKKGK